MSCLCDSAIAQLAERMTVNHDVVGSSPTGGVLFFYIEIFAALVQLVEHLCGIQEVVGSTPTGGFNCSLSFAISFFICHFYI